MTDSFKARRKLSVGRQEYEIFSLAGLESFNVARLPFSLEVLGATDEGVRCPHVVRRSGRVIELRILLQDAELEPAELGTGFHAEFAPQRVAGGLIRAEGVGLPTRPVLAGFGPLTFLPASAPTNLIVQNTGGATLVLNSIQIVGANPNAFFMAGDSSYTPLVGVIGEGEEGRTAHPERDALV